MLPTSGWQNYIVRRGDRVGTLAKFAAIDLFVLLGRQRCPVPPRHAKKMGRAVIEHDPKRMNGRLAVLKPRFLI
jgi:hypothetical protein